jgi:cytochrome P450
MKQRIMDEKSSEHRRKDFMHYLINAKDPQTGEGFTSSELDSESSLLISAGSDTVSITLSSTLFYLLHYPASLEKVATEIRTAFTSVDVINSAVTTKGLPYLRACIDEALRLAPPVPGHLPREVLPGGLVIDAQYYPRGTILGVSSYAIHHYKEYYPQPFKFVPERWIVDDGFNDGFSASRVATARAAFCPFSLGPRGCVGRSMAYLEIMLALSTLLFLYDIRLPDAEREPSGEGLGSHKHWGRRRKDEYQLVEQFLADRDGPMIQFKARLVSSTIESSAPDP